MREYIKCAHRAAIMLFRRGNEADHAKVDAIHAHNKAIATRVYNAIMDGSINHAYTRDGRRLWVYTRSLRGDFVQVSHFCDFDGTMEAISHTDATSPDKMELLHGKYINLVA